MFKINGHQVTFLQTLMDRDGFAKPSDLPPQISQKDNSARTACKRRGWVEINLLAGRRYWCITGAGIAALDRAKETLTIERSLT